jgi:3-phenylpropionate/trans-cinnamate dioxygenase ferredoxin subunit
MSAPENAGGGWVRTCRLAGLGEDSPVHADIGECPVCLVRTGGAVYALHDECTHESVPLSYGDVAGGAIECWKHGSRFDLATGRVLSPPATRPVAVFGVRIDGEDVYVQLSPGGNGGLARRPGVRPPGARGHNGVGWCDDERVDGTALTRNATGRP